MSECPRQIAVVRTYDELIAALRARSLELNATREAIDEVAGLQKGYTAKVFAPAAPKGLGRQSMGPILSALGLMLLLVEDEAAVKRYGNRVAGGKRSYILNGSKNVPVILKFSRRRMKELAQKGGTARAAKLAKRKRIAIARKAGKSSRKNVSPERASEIGRNAIKARWSKPRIIEISAPEALCLLNGGKSVLLENTAKRAISKQ